MSDGGKGDSPRPFSVSREQYGANMDSIFGEKKRWGFIKECGCYRCMGLKYDDSCLLYTSPSPRDCS